MLPTTPLFYPTRPPQYNVPPSHHSPQHPNPANPKPKQRYPSCKDFATARLVAGKSISKGLGVLPEDEDTDSDSDADEEGGGEKKADMPGVLRRANTSKLLFQPGSAATKVRWVLGVGVHVCGCLVVWWLVCLFGWCRVTLGGPRASGLNRPHPQTLPPPPHQPAHAEGAHPAGGAGAGPPLQPRGLRLRRDLRAENRCVARGGFRGGSKDWYFSIQGFI